MRSFFSLSQASAGLVAVLIGFTSSVALVLQAAAMVGADAAQTSSWLLALGLSIAAACMTLSWVLKMPILIGWSTPGAALLATSLAGVPVNEAVGAFMLASLLTLMLGLSGWMERIMQWIPPALASAMIAGILLPFGLQVFAQLPQQPSLIFGMLLTYLLGKRYFPRYGMMLTILIGISLAKLEGLVHVSHLSFHWTHPTWIMPVFSWSALFSVALPLFMVNVASQNIPGLAVLNGFGYRPPVSKLMSILGSINLLTAPMGCYSITLTALTAAICASEEADEDPLQRYKSTIFGGLCWLVIGLLGAEVVQLFASFPKELVAAVAGIALISTISTNLHAALDDPQHRESSILTILVSGSGMMWFGVGGAFWGLLAGIISWQLLHAFKVNEAEVVLD